FFFLLLLLLLLLFFFLFFFFFFLLLFFLNLFSFFSSSSSFFFLLVLSSFFFFLESVIDSSRNIERERERTNTSDRKTPRTAELSFFRKLAKRRQLSLIGRSCLIGVVARVFGWDGTPW